MMVTSNTTMKNAGYLLVLLPQFLYVVGTLKGAPWLPVAFFFLLLPVLRYLVGNDVSAPNVTPSPALVGYLRFIPRAYVAVWAFVLPWTISYLGSHHLSGWEYVGLGLSLWIVTSLNTAVAHEMVHSGGRFDRTLGMLLDASVGYFHFAEEHLSHHARTGHHHGGDSARQGVSLYAYALERYLRSHAWAWEFEASRLKRKNLPFWSSRPLKRALVPLSIATAFFVFAGWQGLLFYAAQVVGAAFSVQAITYLQHWGLSQKETPDLADFGFAWEDGCWMQACVTLNHAYHGQHHLSLRMPYYKLSMPPGALTLPASYPVMFLLALVPPLFTKVMNERLRLWLDDVDEREAMAGQMSCIGAARVARMIRAG
jgi:alkane 1-monooxygenase